MTKNIIADEIEGSHKAEIEEKEQKLKEVNNNLAELENSIRQQNIYITDTYGPYLGKEYLDTDKLHGMSRIIMAGTASNITEAIEMDKTERESQKKIRKRIEKSYNTGGQYV